MNITTQNIDEWCFRYLEKDLNDEECVFFENELKNNPSLAKQVSLWQKTVLKPEVVSQIDTAISKHLFRYKTQFLSVLLEFILVGSLMCFFLYNTKKETATRDIDAVHNDPPSASINTPTDTVATENFRLTKQAYINSIIDQKSDSVLILQNGTKYVEPDTTISNENVALPVSQESTQADSVKDVADTTAAQKKAVQKKSTRKYKYKGSRLIPINNDL